MFRNLKAVILAVGVIMVFGLSASAGYGDAGTSGTAKKATAVGNGICPVTGEMINKKSEVNYEYKGKIYSFCCKECIDEFQKDPAKYIAKVKKTGAADHGHAAH